MTALLQVASTVAAHTSEPVSADEVKRHLRIPSAVTTDDEYLNDLIQQAREQVQSQARISLVQETVTEKRNGFPFGESFMELRKRSPLVSITSINYLASGVSTLWTASGNYQTDTTRRPGVVWLVDGASWPAADTIQNAVTTVYLAGYATAAAVPAREKFAVMLAVELMYDSPKEMTGISYEKLKERYDQLIESIATPTYP